MHSRLVACGMNANEDGSGVAERSTRVADGGASAGMISTIIDIFTQQCIVYSMTLRLALDEPSALHRGRSTSCTPVCGFVSSCRR